MHPNKYGPGSRGMERSLPIGDREDYVQGELYPSQIKRILKGAEEEAGATKVLETREKFGKLRKSLEHQ